MTDPQLPAKLRRFAQYLDRQGDIVGAGMVREAANQLDRQPDRQGVARPGPPTVTPDPECIVAGCATLVPLWEHNTRCAAHRADPAPPPIRPRREYL